MNPTPLRDVLQQEVERIETARRLRLEKDERGRPVEKTLIGLAFCGGRIRRATFNLGVLQALARKKLLRKFVVTTAALTRAFSGYLFLPFSKILIPADARRRNVQQMAFDDVPRPG